MDETPVFTVVGKAIPRVEGPDKVTGRAQYTADVLPPGALWATYVRSPHAHARIVSVDTSRAVQVPGVVAVVTGRDLPHKRVGSPLQDLPVLCRDRVRFVGDRVAVVCCSALPLAVLKYSFSRQLPTSSGIACWMSENPSWNWQVSWPATDATPRATVLSKTSVSPGTSQDTPPMAARARFIIDQLPMR